VGIARSQEFQKKGLATHALNVGLKCGHECLYCSTPALLRTHRAFQEFRESPFSSGYCVVDPETPDRILSDVRRLTPADTVMLSTLTDPWAPEAQEHDLGRRNLVVLLRESGCQVRILTKNAAVRRDFDLMASCPGRITVGLSMSVPPERADIAAVLEPFASPIAERIEALHEARQKGIRLFGMLCPALPGVSDSIAALESMFRTVLVAGAEDIWLEPINPRGPALKRCEEALRTAGYGMEADAFGAIRNRRCWGEYASRLVRRAQQIASVFGAIDRLHVLLYENQFMPEHVVELKKDNRGLIWLGK